MGSSTSYKLEIADQTNSGSAGSSAGYGLSAGVTGDKFDGTGSSTSYKLCAGFVEEAYNSTFCGGAVNGTLTVVIHVVNDNGGSLVASNFTFHVTLGGVDVAGSPAAGAEAPGVSFSLAPAGYTVSVNPNALYNFSYGPGCPGGSVVLPSGGAVTCTVTADDIAPPSPPGPGGSGYMPQPTQEIPTEEISPLVIPTEEIIPTEEVIPTEEIIPPQTVTAG